MNLDDAITRLRDEGLERLPDASTKLLDKALDAAGEHAAKSLPDAAKPAAFHVLATIRDAGPELAEAGRDELRILLTDAHQAITVGGVDRLRDMGYEARRRAMLDAGAEALEEMNARAARAALVGRVLADMGRAALAAAPKVLPMLIAVL